MQVTNLRNGPTTKNFNLDVMYRIMRSLMENGPTKITQLSFNCGLNYNRCKSYVLLMNCLEWLEILYENKNLKIKCSESGIKLLGNIKKFKDKS